MSANTNLGRWTLNHLPYVSQVAHDWNTVRTLGVKMHKHPRLFGHASEVTLKLTRKYPPRIIWVTATRQGGVHMGFHLWSQRVK